MRYIKEQVDYFHDVIDALDERLKNYLKYEGKYIIYTNRKNILWIGSIKGFNG